MNSASTQRGSYFVECPKCYHTWDTDRAPAAEYNENVKGAKILELYHVARKRFKIDEDGNVTNLAEFGSIFGKRFGRFRDYLATAVNRQLHALDVGFGSGGALFFFNNLGYSVHGVDTNPTAVEFARESLPDAQIVQGEFDPAQISEKMDVISCFHVLEHVPDVVGFLKELRSTTSNGGILILEVPNLYNDWCVKNDCRKWVMWNDNGMHLQHFSHDSVLLSLQKSGWSLMEFIGAGDSGREAITLIAKNRVEAIDRAKMWAVTAT